jgi:hypothetical protein
VNELDRRLLAIRDHLELDLVIDHHCDHVDKLLDAVQDAIEARAREAATDPLKIVWDEKTSIDDLEEAPGT